jgi:hypothetical protein
MESGWLKRWFRLLPPEVGLFGGVNISREGHWNRRERRGKKQ